MKKLLLFSMSLIFAAGAAHAACEVAVYNADTSAKVQLTKAMATKLQTVLRAQDKKNSTVVLVNPYITTSDYVYALSPLGLGLNVSVGLVGTTYVVYNNVYNKGHFKSATHLTNVLAQDFETSVLPYLSRCQATGRKK